MATPWRQEFHIFQGRDQQYYWRLVLFLNNSDRGEIIAVSGEGHPTVRQCENEIGWVKLSSQTRIYYV